jgi:uncharacterized protein (DUF302 family)
MKNVSITLICVGLLQACVLNLPDPIADMGYESKAPSIEFDKYSVYSDNNEDRIVNKGETVGLQVWLKNTGTRVAKSVKATFSTSSIYVSSFTPTAQISYGDIAEGNTQMVDYIGYSANYTIKLTISSSTPADTQIPINISITDESGNMWTESFNVTVVATNAQITYDKYSVYSDNNEDRIINKGETVGLQVWLKNTGTSTAKGVKATFSTSSTYVSSFTPTAQISYGDISAGNSKMVDYIGYATNYTIRFTISSSTPADTQIPINISITDESGNTWTESFNVTVAATNAQIIYEKHSVYSDNNDDGIVNKGETVELQVWLKNTGTSAAKGVKATFSTTSAYISDFTPTTQINYGDIAAGNSKMIDYLGYNINYTIQFTISSSTPPGIQIPINISITDESSNTWTESFTITVAATNAQIVYDKYGVYSDNTKDKIVNRSETVGLQVWLKNIGTSTAKRVKATFSTTSTYVSGFTPTTQIDYSDIAAGNSKMVNYNGYTSSSNNYTIRFTISSSTPVGTQIPINISITDENDNTWVANFDVPVADIYTPPGAGTITWTFGDQIWSGALSIDVCTKVSYLSIDDLFYPPDSQYRDDANGYGYYYNWTCVRYRGTTLCPTPWRVPSKEDMQKLINNTTSAALVDAWGYGGYARSGGSNYTKSSAYYWSSTESQGYYSYALDYDAYSHTITGMSWISGLQVRCVL